MQPAITLNCVSSGMSLTKPSLVSELLDDLLSSEKRPTANQEDNEKEATYRSDKHASITIISYGASENSASKPVLLTRLPISTTNAHTNTPRRTTNE